MKSFLTLIVLFISSSLLAQKGTLFSKDSGTVKGILVISPWRTHTSIDYFFPANINTNESLESNIKSNSKDTAYQISLGTTFFENSILSQADTLRNEAWAEHIADYIKYVLVFAIEAKYDKRLQDLFYKNEQDNYLKVPMSLYGHSLFETINSKGLMLRSYRIIQLPSK